MTDRTIQEAQNRGQKISELLRRVETTRLMQVAIRHDRPHSMWDNFPVDRQLIGALKTHFAAAGKTPPGSLDPDVLIAAGDTPRIGAFVNASWDRLLDHERARIADLVRETAARQDEANLRMNVQLTLRQIGVTCADLVSEPPAIAHVLVAWRMAQTLRAVITGVLPGSLDDMAVSDEPTAVGFRGRHTISTEMAKSWIADMGETVVAAIPSFVEPFGDMQGRLGLTQFVIAHRWFSVAARESGHVVLDLSHTTAVDWDVVAHVAVVLDDATRGFSTGGPALTIIGHGHRPETVLETGFRLPVRYVETIDDLIMTPGPTQTP